MVIFFGLILSIEFYNWQNNKMFKFSKSNKFFLGFEEGSITKISPDENPASIFYIFISGAIAICAMVLPGVSGSFILLLMGSYTLILKALNEFNITVIMV